MSAQGLMASPDRLWRFAGILPYPAASIKIGGEFFRVQDIEGWTLDAGEPNPIIKQGLD